MATNITTKRIELSTRDGMTVLFTDHLSGVNEADLLTAKYANPDQVFNVQARNTPKGHDTARLIRAKNVLSIRLAS